MPCPDADSCHVIWTQSWATWQFFAFDDVELELTWFVVICWCFALTNLAVQQLRRFDVARRGYRMPREPFGSAAA